LAARRRRAHRAVATAGRTSFRNIRTVVAAIGYRSRPQRRIETTRSAAQARIGYGRVYAVAMHTRFRRLAHLAVAVLSQRDEKRQLLVRKVSKRSSGADAPREFHCVLLSRGALVRKAAAVGQHHFRGEFVVGPTARNDDERADSSIRPTFGRHDR